MNRKLHGVFRMAGASLLGLSLACPAFAQALPDDTGKAEFVHNCLDCHSAGMVLRARKTPDEWRKNVDDMSARGTDGSKEDMDKVVVYLSKHFATDQPAPVPPPPPSTTPPPRTAREVRLIRQNSVLANRRLETPGLYPGAPSSGRKSLLATNQIPIAIHQAGAVAADERRIKGQNLSELARYLDPLPSFPGDPTK